jgi:hypothetical protein
VLIALLLSCVHFAVTAQLAPPAKPINSTAAAPLSKVAENAETLRLAYRYDFPLVATDRMMIRLYWPDKTVLDALWPDPVTKRVR